MPCTFYAHPFDRIAALAKACGINKAHGTAGDIELFLDSITGRTGNIGDYCTVRTRQRVHEAGFAGVRSADYNDLCALTEYSSFFTARYKLFELPNADPEDCFGIRKHLILHLIGIVHGSGKLARRRDELFFDNGYPAAEPTVKLVERGIRAPVGIGIYEVHDCVGLHKVHLAVQECTLSEFTRVGKP